MGIFDKVQEAAGGNGDAVDKAKNLVNEHEQQVDQGIDKAGDAIDQRTGDKFGDQVDKGQQVLQDKTGNL